MNINIFRLILLFLTFTYFEKALTKEDFVPISFGFSPSWYQKLNDACMQMWGACDEFLESSSLFSAQQYDYFLDNMLGYLYFANFCVNKMQESNHEIYYEDKEYIKRTMSILSERILLIGPDNDKTEAIKVGLSKLSAAFDK